MHERTSSLQHFLKRQIINSKITSPPHSYIHYYYNCTVSNPKSSTISWPDPSFPCEGAGWRDYQDRTYADRPFKSL